jgi:hypothetical protein
VSYSRYVHTIRHLKAIQVLYQLGYRLRDLIRPVKLTQVPTKKYLRVHLADFPVQYNHYASPDTFSFLNKEKAFTETIDWNYAEQGKLWSYHLNYFDFLLQEDLHRVTGRRLIEAYISKLSQSRDGLEPYPISLRTINWIKFMSKHDTYSHDIVDSVYAQYQVLSRKIEYHLLGNHLLENGFSFLFGAVFFKDEQLTNIARKILKSELNEQVLNDGAHFELTPMYHLILLQRALDGYNLLIHNHHDLQDIQSLLQVKVQAMVNWMHSMRFLNGDYPMFNDSTPGQALDPQTVLNYATSLGFEVTERALMDSGYRKFTNGEFELIADVGEVGPSYQPGHAHCDILSFVMYFRMKPIFVDRGISTYEKNALREEERGTASHNTVMINDVEQSDVWGGFRVGRKAKPIIIKDTHDHLIASHTGYYHISATHQREWRFTNCRIHIIDTTEGNVIRSVAYFHMYPEVSIKQLDDNHFLINELTISFEGHSATEVLDYMFCEGFNKRTKAQKLAVYFRHTLKTLITESI